MPVNLRGRSFLKLLDFTPAEINYLIKLGHEFKNLKMAGVPHKYLEGKTSFSSSRKLQLVPVLLSRLPAMTLAWA